MARKRIRHWIRRWRWLLGALVAAVVEKVLSASRRIIGCWEVTKPMARKRIRHIVAIVAGLLLNALVAAVVEEVLSALLKHLF